VSGVDGIAFLLRSARFSFQDEIELQDGIAEVLTKAGIPFEREVILSPKDRIDFMVAPAGTGVEIKIKGSVTEITRQIHRYAQLPAITGLVLVTTRMRHINLPMEMAGKPVRVVVIMAGLS